MRVIDGSAEARGDSASAPPPALEIRELRGLDELTRTPALARAIWGEDDRPEDAALLHVIQKCGGLVAGAVDEGGQVWAYLVGLATGNSAAQHSHRLGVHPACRRQQLALRLKVFQRRWCLERGVTRVTWTFDPLLLVNAHLNIHRLGATVSRYLPNEYGEMSGINAGLPSDRFEVDWALDSARVEASLRGAWPEVWPDTALPLRPDGALPDRSSVVLRVPADFGQLRRDDPAQALTCRMHGRQMFSGLFGHGYSLVDVSLKRQAYLLRRPDSGQPC